MVKIVVLLSKKQCFEQAYKMSYYLRSLEVARGKHSVQKKRCNL